MNISTKFFLGQDIQVRNGDIYRIDHISFTKERIRYGGIVIANNENIRNMWWDRLFTKKPSRETHSQWGLEEDELVDFSIDDI